MSEHEDQPPFGNPPPYSGMQYPGPPPYMGYPGPPPYMGYPGPPPYMGMAYQRPSAQFYRPPPYMSAQSIGPPPYMMAQAQYGSPPPYMSYPGPPPYMGYPGPPPYMGMQQVPSAQFYRPPPYLSAQYAGPPPYMMAQAQYGSPPPYMRAMYAQPQPVSLGWSMWRFDGSGWELMDDRSQGGGSANPPDLERGKFVGQIVRTPSVMAPRASSAPTPPAVNEEYTISEIVRRAGEVPGYGTDDELRWIVGTASALPAGSTWLEVGALCGRSFLAAGLSLPIGCTLITVDQTLGQTIRRGQSMLETYRELSYERHDLRLVMMRSDSIGAARLVPPQSCSVIYIDADHSGPAVRRDVQAWTPKLAPGGLLCGHDHGHPEYPGLTQAVDELEGSTVAVGSIWVWYP